MKNINKVLSNNLNFKKKFTKEQRLYECMRIIEKYPDRIPIIVESDGLELDKIKYLVPKDLTLGQFLFVIRKRLNVPSSHALYLFINGSILSSSEILNSVYFIHRDIDDGFLYITIKKESTFG